MNDLKEMYLLAVRNEALATNLYTYLFKACTDEILGEKLKQLAAFEKGHEEKIMELARINFPEIVFVTNEDMVPDILTTIKTLNDIKDVIVYAISQEQKANELYLEISKSITDELVKDTVLTFAREELNHKELLETELMDIEGIFIWIDPSELAGIMED